MLWETFHQANQVVNQSRAPKRIYTIPGTQQAIIIFSRQDFASTAVSPLQKCLTPADESDQHHNIT